MIGKFKHTAIFIFSTADSLSSKHKNIVHSNTFVFAENY